MSTRHRMTIGGTALILGLSMAAATVAQSAVQGSDDHAAHHPEGARTAQATPQPVPVAPAPTAPVAPGMGRPGGMMMPGGTGPMMPMMQGRMGGPMGDGMPGMGGMRQGAMMPFHRIEGWLAFLRAELRITDAQAPQWNAYADAMRARAQGLRDTMARTMQSADQPATAPQIMERRSALLSAQGEAMRAVSGTLGALYAALSDEQKRTADELIGGHIRGMGMP